METMEAKGGYEHWLWRILKRIITSFARPLDSIWLFGGFIFFGGEAL